MNDRGKKAVNPLDKDWFTTSAPRAPFSSGGGRPSRASSPRRRAPSAPPPGSVNAITGKPYRSAGYAARTINHNLPVVKAFYCRSYSSASATA